MSFCQQCLVKYRWLLRRHVVDTPLENLCETLDNGKGSWHILTNRNSLSGLSHSASKLVQVSQHDPGQ
ncbi:MAG: hypothetical protein V7L29_11785 [Nostoc sp.]|uniref:hypothetical protein n=1 Tax=Nostoc sp. TaxID=1180 RepID=UPI002FF944A2